MGMERWNLMDRLHFMREFLRCRIYRKSKSARNYLRTEYLRDSVLLSMRYRVEYDDRVMGKPDP